MTKKEKLLLAYYEMDASPRYILRVTDKPLSKVNKERAKKLKKVN